MLRPEMRVLLAVLVTAVVSGCAAPKANIADLKKPDRPKELESLNVFVGSWTWEATMENADEKNRSWSGTTDWEWAMDNRGLHGKMSSRSAGGIEFNALSLIAWHPKRHNYLFWMFNDWGYPQEGTARFNGKENEWEINYTAIGLDGTPSYGEYELQIKDNNTIDWEMTEWADGLHMVKKMHMKGTYKRK